ESLPKADRDAIDSVSGEALAWVAGKAWDDADAKAVELLKSMNFDSQEPSPALFADIKKRLAPLDAKWLERAKAHGLDGRAVLEDYKKEIAKVKLEMKNR
ncbi:MAG TPA: hypothetical protein VIV54_23710, partial [Burkholderiales bacterium]